MTRHIRAEELGSVQALGRVLTLSLRAPKTDDEQEPVYPVYPLILTLYVKLTWGRTRTVNLRGKSFCPAELSVKNVLSYPYVHLGMRVEWYEISSGALVDRVLGPWVGEVRRFGSSAISSHLTHAIDHACDLQRRQELARCDQSLWSTERVI